MKSHRNIHTCRAGPLPDPEVDRSDIPDKFPDFPNLCADNNSADDDDSVDIPLEDGNHILVASIPPEEEFICASLTTSQQLAEAFHKNTKPKTFCNSVPTHLHDFEDIFAKSSFDALPNHKPWDHVIELIPDAKPVNCKVYPLAPNEQKELNQFILKNLQTGCICPSKLPMALPVFFVKKKDGSLCLIQDYCALNAMTVKNRYLLPLISDLINQLCSANYFTKLDVRWGYQNVQMKEGDEWKAAFQTSRGLFEPLVMFFGLTNSPSTFQTMMNEIFQDLIMEGVVCVYLDNILIYTKTMEEHSHITCLVLE